MNNVWRLTIQWLGIKYNVKILCCLTMLFVFANVLDQV